MAGRAMVCSPDSRSPAVPRSTGSAHISAAGASFARQPARNGPRRPAPRTKSKPLLAHTV